MSVINRRTFHLWGEVCYPIFPGSLKPDGFAVEGIAGTGFVPIDGLLVTCWHCVRAVSDGTAFAIGLPPPPGSKGGALEKVFVLSDIERDPRGFDLATARVDVQASRMFNLSPDYAAAGTDVWAAGFPMPRRELLNSGRFRTDLTPRHLQGYVVREFDNPDHPGFPLQPTYELDMLAPGGLSGAPLLVRTLAPVGLRLTGIVYGSHDSFTVAEEMEISPAQRLEVRRYVSFGWAHSLEVVSELMGAATDGRTLADLMSRSPSFD